MWMDKEKLGMLLAKITAYASIVLGVAAIIYSCLGIYEYGFYLSERWNPGQLEGGYLPVILLTGLGLVAYGLIELWIHRPVNQRKKGAPFRRPGQ